MHVVSMYSGINGAICLPLMSLMSISVPRLLSLAKSSLTENSGDFVAGTHPDTNPEHSRGIFSGLLAGEKALPDKWAVGICMYVCACSYPCVRLHAFLHVRKQPINELHFLLHI